MKCFLRDVVRVWRNEFQIVSHDIGALVFLFLLPLAYPLVYSSIYNPELARDIPIVIVDDSRSSLSREYARHLAATQELDVIGYAADMDEARRAMVEKRCYAVVHIPREFTHDIVRHTPATISAYCDMSLLMRYKSVLVAVTSVALNFGGEGGEKSLVQSMMIPIGNVSQGIASALMPGVLVLIVQQCILLAISLVGATKCREGGWRCVGVSPLANIWGKALCYFVLMIVPTIFVLHFVPKIFSFPMEGRFIDVAILAIPYLWSVIFFSMLVQRIVPDREATFIVVVFTSVAFVFLSGVSWPRYAMSEFWLILGNCVPSTWAINGYVAINTSGATLSMQKETYSALWILASVYFVLTWLLEHRKKKG